MTGAVSLTATAAFRADAGYVTVCAPAESLPVIEGRLLEAVKRPLEEALEAQSHGTTRSRSGRASAGHRERRALVRRLLEETELPAVVDADALFGLEPFERTAPTVLTPHEGELGRLLGRESGVGRRPPARGGHGGRRALRLRLPAQGRRRARRRSRPRRCSSPRSARRRSRPPERATSSPA